MRLPASFQLLPVLILLAAGTCGAADAPKKEGGFGTGKATGAYLTRDQLRACLNQQTHVKEQDDELRKKQAELTAMKDEIARGGEALKTKLEGMDRTNAEAVAAYNLEAAAHDKQIDDYQAGVTTFNARVDASKADRETFAKACDNRRYFEEDEISLRKAK